MSSNFQPGDVAMVSALNKPAPYRAYFDGTTWREYGHGMFCVDRPNTIRPLVVIDPADREQVERLASLIVSDAELMAGWVNRLDITGSVSRSLRSLVTPPKPPEPQGLGAVVEDERGVLWTRWTGEEPSAAWKCSIVGQGCEPWTKVAAVKVLSEGVTP